MAHIHTITGITGTRVTDGRTPTTNERGKKRARTADLEGSTSMKIGKDGVIKSTNNAAGANADAIEKMIDRNASSFRRDIVARSNKKKQPRHNGSCD